MLSNTQHATSYEWSISNPTWVLSNSSSQSVNLAISSPGIGTLSVYGVNECGVSNPATLNIQSTVNIEDIEDLNEIEIFPNPTTSIVNINNRSTKLLTHLMIYDLTGKLIEKFDLNNQNNCINIEFLSTGFYILKLFDQDQIIKTTKMIKN